MRNTPLMSCSQTLTLLLCPSLQLICLLRGVLITLDWPLSANKLCVVV